MIRTKRTERKRSVTRVDLTSRDKAILYSFEMKFLKTEQLARLHFGRLTSTVRIRLRRLADAGLIKAWMPSLHEQNVYSLTQKGLHILEEDNSRDGAALCVPRRLDRRLQHLLSANDVHIALICALAAQNGEVVEWRSDWQLKKPGERGLIPDALFQ